MTPDEVLAGIRALRGGPLRPYPKLRARISRTATKTPRKQTGTYRTNRENRWAVDPTQPDYATREVSAAVELMLLAQLFEFTNAPTLDAAEAEVVERALGRRAVAGTYRCPISGRRLDFAELVASTDTNPVHGRSPYAVGHMKPLHHMTNRGAHVPDNIRWVHEQGNRVQGNLSVDEAAAEVYRIADFHRDRQGLSWDDVHSVAEGRQPAPEEYVITEPQAEEV